MTRKRDIQRRFLEKNGWCFWCFGIRGWFFPTSHEYEYCYLFDREVAFKIELSMHSEAVRRKMKSLIRASK